MSTLTDLIDFAHEGIDRRTLNGTLSGARNPMMLSLIGDPRGTYSDDCQPATNPKILALVDHVDLGPFKVTGLRPALVALQAIMADIREEFPNIYNALGSEGMMCCRLVRGSATAISNHSWGTAVDLTLEGRLDDRGDGKAQRGLMDIYPIFNRHGFFWGAAFPTEDSMHFEASDQLIRKWAADGIFGAVPKGIPSGLTIGDRSARVERLQSALNRALDPIHIAVDGIFGKDTRAALTEFQRRRGLAPTGIGSAPVLAMLGV